MCLDVLWFDMAQFYGLLKIYFNIYCDVGKAYFAIKESDLFVLPLIWRGINKGHNEADKALFTSPPIHMPHLSRFLCSSFRARKSENGFCLLFAQCLSTLFCYQCKTSWTNFVLKIEIHLQGKQELVKLINCRICGANLFGNCRKLLNSFMEIKVVDQRLVMFLNSLLHKVSGTLPIRQTSANANLK